MLLIHRKIKRGFERVERNEYQSYVRKSLKRKDRIWERKRERKYEEKKTKAREKKEETERRRMLKMNE